MGNSGSSNGHRRRSRTHTHPPPPPTQQPQPEISGNRYVFAAATPYPPQYPNQNPPHYYQYSGYYPPPPPPPPPTMPLPLPAPYDHRGGGPPHVDHTNWVGGRYPCGPVPPPPAPYVEHQKAVTIRNDVNLKKESLRVEVDQENPGRFLVAFTFDATVAGRNTVKDHQLRAAWCPLQPPGRTAFSRFCKNSEIKLRPSSGVVS
ncbi:hypothetical protein IFM89_004746 [Coptis chinensis]|uniref:RING-type E3 ubiquitin transferase n=1 Tax=Coptis chinensis TaxID=261450 RepID=A0A835LHJ8_9MAGN|nr:hypothetical protein IFM89_004746 [Coptis chinensis]